MVIPIPNLREQFKRNSVALISLSIAVFALTYNTWRNERTSATRSPGMTVRSWEIAPSSPQTNVIPAKAGTSVGT